MEITGQTTLQTAALAASPATVMVSIDNSVLLHSLKDCPTLAAVSHCMKSSLKNMLAILTVRLSRSRNIVVDLSLSRLEYPIHFWEEALFLAAQEAEFPYVVYVTEQGTADRLQYMAQNRSLQKFVSRLEKMESTENTTLGDENILKRTIMLITRQCGLDEQALGLALAETRNLEQLIHYCETHSGSSHRARDT